MSVKQLMKDVIGQQRLSDIKGIIYNWVYNAYFIIKGKSKLNYELPLSVEKIISNEGYHVFRGYYDIEYFDDLKERFLVHRLPTDAKTNKDTVCEIGYYEFQNNSFVKVAETSAWCWQQGARLRWHPVEKNMILYNDVYEENYCTKVYDTEKDEIVNIINMPLYDVSNDFSWGVSINFSRLQRLRPGYGYNYFDDKTINDNAPNEDGIYIVDIDSNTSNLIISLRELAQKVDKKLEMIHYINHISIAPNNERFMFFHIYVEKNVKGWKTVLYVSDKEGKNIVQLEGTDRVSHYCWIDNDNIMVTCHKENNEEYYAIYNVNTREKRVLDIKGLSYDGHPSRIGLSDWYITDSYPREKSLQNIQFFRIGDSHVQISAKLYHDYRLRGEKRCDLHPVITKDGKYISIDTTYKNKRRGVIIFGCEEL